MLITPSSRSKTVLVRSHSYAPSFRGFRVGNTRHPLQCRLTICNQCHPLQLIALRLALPRDIQYNTTSIRLSCRRSFLCCSHRLVYKIWSVCTNHYPDHPPLKVKGLYYNKRRVNCYSTLLKLLNDFVENCSVKVPNVVQ